MRYFTIFIFFTFAFCGWASGADEPAILCGEVTGGYLGGYVAGCTARVVFGGSESPVESGSFAAGYALGAASTIFAVGEVAGDSVGDALVVAVGALAGTGAAVIVGELLGEEGALVGFLLAPLTGTALYNYAKLKVAPHGPDVVPAVFVSVSF